MRRVDVKFRQMMDFGGRLHALDIRGNIWIQDTASPQGWRRMKPPTIELEDFQPVGQIPQQLQPTGPLVRTVNFSEPLKNHKSLSGRRW